MNYLRRMQMERPVLFWVGMALAFWLGFQLVLFVAQLILGPFGLPAWAPLALPSLWGVLEWTRASLGWLAAPWCVLGYTQSGRPETAGVAALAGVWGVSFVLMGAGVWLAGFARSGHDAVVRWPPVNRTTVGRAHA